MSDREGEYIIILCAECGVIVDEGQRSCGNCLNDVLSRGGQIVCNVSREDYEKAERFL